MKKKIEILWLLSRIKRFIPKFLILIAAQVFSAIIAVEFALGSRRIIDCAVDGGSGLLRAVEIQAVLILLLLLSQYIQREISQRLLMDLEKNWKQQLLHQLLGGKYTQVSAYHSGELLNRMNSDVSTVDSALLSVIPGLTGMVTKLIASFYALQKLEPRFTVVMAAVGVLVVLVTGIARKQLKELHKRVSEANGRVASFLQEAIEKILMIQAMDLSDEIEVRSGKLLDERYVMQRKRKNVSIAANTGISVTVMLTSFAALVWCSIRLSQGAMSFGSLTAVTSLAGQLQTPFVSISGVLPQYFAMLASAERLMELEAIEPREGRQTKDPWEMYDRMEAICAEHLCFSYTKDRKPVLQQMDFRMEKGKFIVLTGPSGVGKSTLLKLLLGITQPDGGRLYVSTRDGELSLSELGSRFFSFVPQGNLLLSGTIRENLLLARPDATQQELEQALYISTAEEYVQQLPQGIDTVIGENGLGLSEGQVQRLAIARAILRETPLLLLDEATSALDAQTEQKVLTRLRALENVTCIIVTHRPAAIALCDVQIEMPERAQQPEQKEIPPVTPPRA